MTTLKEKIKNLSDGINQMSDGEMRPVTKGFFKTMLEDYKRHAELEDKLEQGLMVERPCAIGTTVYGIWEKPYTHESKYGKRNRKGHMISDYKFLSRVVKAHAKKFEVRPFKMQESYYRVLGKSVFLTQAEAEAKLKEIEGIA